MTKQSNAKQKDLKHQKQNEKTVKRSAKERSRIEKSRDEVAIDSDQSFPASDPPSWTGITGPEVADEKELEKETSGKNR